MSPASVRGAKYKRGGFERSICANEAEVRLVRILDRIIVKAPRDRAGGLSRCRAGEHHFIEARLIGLGAGRFSSIFYTTDLTEKYVELNKGE